MYIMWSSFSETREASKPFSLHSHSSCKYVLLSHSLICNYHRDASTCDCFLFLDLLVFTVIFDVKIHSMNPNYLLPCKHPLSTILTDNMNSTSVVITPNSVY